MDSLFSLEELWFYAEAILNATLFTVKDTPITLSSFLVLLIILVIIFVFSKGVKRVLLKQVFPKVNMEVGLQYTLARITQYIILSIGFIFSFQFIGIDLSGLTVIFGLLSVGIGFGLQNLTSNFISGIIVMFERPIQVGDRIFINDIEGDVTEINIRSTRIQSVNNISYIVPNADFVSNTVINYSHADRKIKVDVNVGVSYSSNVDTVKEALINVAMSHPEVLKSPEPEVLFLSFGDSAWDMRLRVWINDPKRRLYVLSDLNEAIVHEFRKYEIEIPFPQRDLHLRSTVASISS